MHCPSHPAAQVHTMLVQTDFRDPFRIYKGPITFLCDSGQAKCNGGQALIRRRPCLRPKAVDFLNLQESLRLLTHPPPPPRWGDQKMQHVLSIIARTFYIMIMNNDE